MVTTKRFHVYKKPENKRREGRWGWDSLRSLVQCRLSGLKILEVKAFGLANMT